MTREIFGDRKPLYFWEFSGKESLGFWDFSGLFV